MVRMWTARLALVATAAMAGSAAADVHQCHVIDVDFTPAENTNAMSARHEPSQIVVWLEDATGNYLQTLYITAQTGRFGLGNRPGRWDFNAGPLFPYGHRVQTFPVWAHRKPERFPAVIFQNMEGTDPSCVRAQCSGMTTEQCNMTCAVPDTCDGLTGAAYTNCGDNDLSHPSSDSSSEQHFCRPLSEQYDAPKWQQADAMTCATVAFTDKGKFSTLSDSLYPPRLDLVRNAPIDSPSVDMYKQLAGFDAVSHATPAADSRYRGVDALGEPRPQPEWERVRCASPSAAGCKSPRWLSAPGECSSHPRGRVGNFGTCHNYRFNEAVVGRVLNRSRYGASGTPSLTFRKP